MNNLEAQADALQAVLNRAETRKEVETASILLTHVLIRMGMTPEIKRFSVPCAVCGKELDRISVDHNVRTCSPECSAGLRKRNAIAWNEKMGKGVVSSSHGK